MADAIQVKVFLPKNVNAKEVRFKILNELRHQGVVMQNLLGTTVANWEHEKPKFDTMPVTFKKGEPTVIVRAIGDPLGVQKWNWLDEGTSIRRMKMSKDHINKTHPNSLSVTPGRTRKMWLVSPGYPGIQPRNFSILAVKQRKPFFEVAMRRAVIQGIRKAMGKP